jgi:hypothetical protein
VTRTATLDKISFVPLEKLTLRIRAGFVSGHRFSDAVSSSSPFRGGTSKAEFFSKRFSRRGRLRRAQRVFRQTLAARLHQLQKKSSGTRGLRVSLLGRVLLCCLCCPATLGKNPAQCHRPCLPPPPDDDPPPCDAPPPCEDPPLGAECPPPPP